MSNQQSFESKLRIIGLLRWVAPVGSFVFALIAYLVLDDDLRVIVTSGLVVLAVLEFFTFRVIANKMERQAQRDRG